MLRRRAFTLIELLVVIAIIAILAAILFPVFAQAKASAKKAARLSDMKQLAIATQIYAADSDDVTPMAWAACVDGEHAGGSIDNCTTNNRRGWNNRLFPYVKNNDIFIDRAGSPQPFPRDQLVVANFGTRPNMAMNWHIGWGHSTSSFERVSQLVILGESGVRDWFGNGVLVGAASSLNPWDWRDIWGWMGVSDGARRSIRCAQHHKLGDAWMMNHYDPQLPWTTDFRHQEGANFPHADGSARFYRMGSLQPENWYRDSIPGYARDGRNNCDE